MRYYILIAWFFGSNMMQAQFASKALKAYESGDYANSILFWDQELKSDKCNKEQAYFLLGNAHFKNKNYAYAIANYEKSLRENYNQEDVKFNIKVVRAKLGLDTENKILFTNDILRKICFFFSEFTLKLFVVFLSMILVAYSIFRYFKGDMKLGFLRHYLFALTFILAILFFLQQYFKSQSGPAVISIESTGFENINLKGESKTLREGEIVQILDEVGETIQVETEANKIYWIQKSNVIYI
ncbi:MAG: tetratricopeptide repeat protein [Chitinophagales bacterium]|jgi:tetratricopeptide (TPR) repeat protein